MAAEPSLDQFVAALPASGPLLGLDLGTKTIGVAISDIGRRVASPLTTLAKRRFADDAEALRTIVAERAAVGFVLGLPLNMDGSEGPRVQATRAFARNLAAAISLPIAFWDERLSTAAVTRTLIEADRSRARRAELVDKMAASYILQGFLDRLRTLAAGKRAPTTAADRDNR
ncbi:MAG: Holliday junction resolvase RuvX [Bauldia sp.]